MDYLRLFERAENLDPRLQLIEYIYNVQGFTVRRLDYGLAAKKLSLSRKTIARYCDELADVGIIQFQGNALQLTEQLMAE